MSNKPISVITRGAPPTTEAMKLTNINHEEIRDWLSGKGFLSVVSSSSSDQFILIELMPADNTMRTVLENTWIVIYEDGGMDFFNEGLFNDTFKRV